MMQGGAAFNEVTKLTLEEEPCQSTGHCGKRCKGCFGSHPPIMLGSSGGTNAFKNKRDQNFVGTFNDVHKQAGFHFSLHISATLDGIDTQCSIALMVVCVVHSCLFLSSWGHLATTHPQK